MKLNKVLSSIFQNILLKELAILTGLSGCLKQIEMKSVILKKPAEQCNYHPLESFLTSLELINKKAYHLAINKTDYGSKYKRRKTHMQRRLKKYCNCLKMYSTKYIMMSIQCYTKKATCSYLWVYFLRTCQFPDQLFNWSLKMFTKQEEYLWFEYDSYKIVHPRTVVKLN